ncbi:MAG: acyl-CoA dehydrogenase family protein [Achromobacter sp.]|jgi:alkylation response protein AidB-like acyl-CoA dehydrogenase|uniref:Crotonobetainyl-CoA reductase n=1 Tax=Achromobacter insuavis TaxID=1287735 RepID=A0A6J4ZP22_9BURK|nr:MULTISPECIES: acyl-CoA dehydrogenase family protein [Achromobacter]MBN9637892.1 acyl-CoA dehydrogenase family protein [Achromobacter sp.]CAB3636121.1 Crotonobetainyl-CoA reductase [Achromobacter insuavis]CUI67552.1 Acyl-CoA dehydrogenase%2C short-chain specific [Achromobacter sp. 2789STDY5608628]CUI80268.1 Acyl-CoA dehydrogenase%2C short-chain specific [Achromobacter sp. 2789STDY5608633]
MSGVDHDLIEEIRDSARDFLQRRDQRQRKRAETPPDRDYWREIAEVGWLGMSVPETLGGLGLGWRAMAAVLEEAGRAQLPEPLVGAGVLPAALLARIEPVDAARRDALLQAVCGGETLLGLAWQETEGQLEAGEAATAFGVSVIEREGAYVLNGEKRHVMPGAGVDGWLVTADGERGTALFFVAAGTPGVTAQVHARADGGAACHLAIESAVVPADALLARDGVLDAVDEALDLGRLMQSAELAGVARQALADSVAYLNTRQQFGRPLASFQALQHRLVDAAMQVELAANSLLDALDTLDARPGDATLRKTVASRAKARAARAGLEATRLAIQLHGAIGYTEECDVSLYFRSALHLAAWLGNATAHRQRYGALAALPAPGADDDDAVPITDFPREADWNGMPEADFRRLVRGFFRAHYPEHLRHVPWRLHWDEIKDWYFTLARQGWIAPSWPREHGGMALSPARQIAFIEEAERHGVARAPDQGLVMLGPILIRHGTEEQRARFLPGILSGEAVWAQGYSEPNAGSDLASLRCEALVDGDDLIVSGQKTWSTLAQDATHMFMLVRTDKTVKKQAGISFLLVDLASPGVSRRPIRTLSGHEEFCEVFFDQVRVPRANLVGELNAGWGIAKALLGFERLFSGSPKHANHALQQIFSIARQRGLLADPAFADRLAELRLDAADLTAMYSVFAELAKAGRPLPPELSLLKVWATETHERLGALLIQIAEEYGGAAMRLGYGNGQVHALAPYVNALAATIFSGTNEIQRNIYAKQLGLEGA